MRKIDGRFHPITKEKTPSVKDSDIQELIGKYPLKQQQNLQGEKHNMKELQKLDYSLGIKHVLESISNSDQNSLNKTKISFHDQDSQTGKSGSLEKSQKVNTKVIRMCLETLTRNIDRLANQAEESQKEFLVQLVQNDLRNAEMNKMIDLMKEIDFTEGEQIKGAFNYREKDNAKRIKESVDVA